MAETTVTNFGSAAVYLLRGILYRDQREAWEQLLQHRGDLDTYFAALRLRLIVDEAEGYAYLRQRDEEEGDAPDFPRLMSRRKLSYPQTILLVLLRKRLVAFESAGDESRLTLTEQDMIEMMRGYWDELDTNERKREQSVVAAINKLVKFNFLRKMKGERDRYEVRRIIKAYLPIEELQRIYEDLKRYRLRKFGADAAEEE